MSEPQDELLIAGEEGRTQVVIIDTLGYQTIGVGCCVDARVKGAGLCDAAIDAQFDHNATTARHLATLFPAWSAHNPVRQAVLISMCFQMGAKPLGWKQFTAALSRLDYSAAAAAGRDTEWWRNETPKRAEREMAMLEGGVWQERQD